jgi:hypothetical protein
MSYDSTHIQGVVRPTGGWGAISHGEGDERIQSKLQYRNSGIFYTPFTEGTVPEQAERNARPGPADLQQSSETLLTIFLKGDT